MSLHWFGAIMNGKKQMSKSNEILFQKVQPNEVEVKYTKEGKNVIFNKKSEVGNDIRCDVCGKVYHISCENIPYECLLALTVNSNPYRCMACLEKVIPFRYAYKQALARLNKAQQHGFAYLKMCVNQESRFVPKDTYTTTSSLIPDFDKIDKISLEILQQCGLDNVIPFNIESKTTGSCLFDSVSVLLHGDESLSTELRVKTCIEMVQNQTFYETHERAVGFMACSPVFEKACLDCASPRGWSSIWTMFSCVFYTKSRC